MAAFALGCSGCSAVPDPAMVPRQAATMQISAEAQAIRLAVRLAAALCINDAVLKHAGVQRELEFPSEIPPERSAMPVLLADPVIEVNDPYPVEVLRQAIPVLVEELRACQLLLVGPQHPALVPASRREGNTWPMMRVRLESPPVGSHAAATVTVEIVDRTSERLIWCTRADLPKPE